MDSLYDDLNEQDQDAEDSLAAMKKRVAAIEAEAAKISAMSAVDDEDPLGTTSSLTPQKSQSAEANDKKASSTDVNGKSSESKEGDVSAPKKEGEESYPSTIEEQEELDSRSVFIKNVCSTNIHPILYHLSLHCQY